MIPLSTNLQIKSEKQFISLRHTDSSTVIENIFITSHAVAEELLVQLSMTVMVQVLGHGIDWFNPEKGEWEQQYLPSSSCYVGNNLSKELK